MYPVKLVSFLVVGGKRGGVRLYLDNVYVHLMVTLMTPIRAIDSLTNSIYGLPAHTEFQGRNPGVLPGQDIVRALWPTQDMETFPVLSLMRKEEIVSVMWAQHVAKWSATATSLTAWTSIM